MLGLSSIHKYVLPKTSMSKVSEFQDILSPIFKLGYFIIPFFIWSIYIKSVFELIYGIDKYFIFVYFYLIYYPLSSFLSSLAILIC